MATTPNQPTSWSFSKLGDFDKCKKYFWLKHLEKVPEPERPLPPNKTEHANDRGSRIHDNCEQYVRGDHDALCSEADKHFGTHIDFLRLLHSEGKVELEGEWGMDRDWEITGWNGDWKPANELPATQLGYTPKKHSTLPLRGGDEIIMHDKSLWRWVPSWLRLKLDVLVHVGDDEAIVIDYKSGKKWGNEVKHAQQLQLYALVTFLRYPHLEVLNAELWYVDIGETTRQTFTRSQALRFKSGFDRSGKAIVSNTAWPANPNKWSCQWCPYGPEHTGHCDVGVRKAS